MYKLIETNKKSPTQFLEPPFCQCFDQNQTAISDIGQKNNNRVLPKLLNVVLKWIRQNNHGKQSVNFKKLDSNNQIINSAAENSPSDKNRKRTEP